MFPLRPDRRPTAGRRFKPLLPWLLRRLRPGVTALAGSAALSPGFD